MGDVAISRDITHNWQLEVKGLMWPRSVCISDQTD